MRASILEKFGRLDSLAYKEVPEPEPQAGHAVIEIKAFGINHACVEASGRRRLQSLASSALAS
jgi:NADPH:quinone reductase-like Zn-dependent oxidoreductase